MPVRAGKPTSSSAVWLSVKVFPNTSLCGYRLPFCAKSEVESIGKARDCRWKLYKILTLKGDVELLTFQVLE